MAATRLASTTTCLAEVRACTGPEAPCEPSAAALRVCAADGGCDLSTDVECLDSRCTAEIESFADCFFATEACMEADACLSSDEVEPEPEPTEVAPDTAGILPEFRERGMVEELTADAAFTGVVADCEGVGFLEGFGNVTRQLAIGLWPEPGYSKTFYNLEDVVISEDGLSLTFTAGAGFANFRGELRSDAGTVEGRLEISDLVGGFDGVSLDPVTLPTDGFVLGRVSSAAASGSGFWQLACVPGASAD